MLGDHGMWKDFQEVSHCHCRRTSSPPSSHLVGSSSIHWERFPIFGGRRSKFSAMESNLCTQHLVTNVGETTRFVATRFRPACWQEIEKSDAGSFRRGFCEEIWWVWTFHSDKRIWPREQFSKRNFWTIHLCIPQSTEFLHMMIVPVTWTRIWVRLCISFSFGLIFISNNNCSPKIADWQKSKVQSVFKLHGVCHLTVAFEQHSLLLRSYISKQSCV